MCLACVHNTRVLSIDTTHMCVVCIRNTHLYTQHTCVLCIYTTHMCVVYSTASGTAAPALCGWPYSPLQIPSEYPNHDFNNGLGLRCIPMLISTMGWGCAASCCWFSAEQAQQPRNDNKNLRSTSVKNQARTLWFLSRCLFQRPDVRTSGRPDVRMSRRLDIRHLDVRTSEHLGAEKDIEIRSTSSSGSYSNVTFFGS